MQQMKKRSSMQNTQDPLQLSKRSLFMELANRTPLDDSSSDDESIPETNIPNEIHKEIKQASTNADLPLSFPTDKHTDDDSSTINT